MDIILWFWWFWLLLVCVIVTIMKGVKVRYNNITKWVILNEAVSFPDFYADSKYKRLVSMDDATKHPLGIHSQVCLVNARHIKTSVQ